MMARRNTKRRRACSLLLAVAVVLLTFSGFVPKPTQPSRASAAGDTSSARSVFGVQAAGADEETDTPDPPDPPDPAVLQIDVYGCTTNANGNWVQKLGRTSEGGEYYVAGGIGTLGGQLRMLACVTWDDGSAFYQNEAEWRDVVLSWKTSDASVATVNSRGVVTAVGDGTVKITATTPNGVSGSLSIRVFGQSKAYVTSVDIVNDEGISYGDSRIGFDKVDSSATVHLYARIAYSDGTFACNAPNAPDYTPSADLSTLSWSVSNVDVGYVNAASGNFLAKAQGTVAVYAKMTGGDPSENGGVAQDRVWIVIDTGSGHEENLPSSELVVKVVYQDNESLVAETHTFTIAELKAIQNARCTYTLTRSAGNYVTDSAQGIYMTTLLDKLGIVLDEVYAFRFAANDGANPGAITKRFLFDYTRYYFPYFDTGGLMADRQLVMPMLAYADNWREGGTCEEDYSSLNSGTCLRLLFGSTGAADGSTAKSIKYIHTMTIVMAGSPPVGEGGDGGSGSGLDTGSGTGSGDGSGTGTGTGSGIGTGGSTGDGSGTGTGNVTALLNSSGGSGDGDATDGGSGAARGRWQVFEMMGTSASDIDPIILDNPLQPWALPSAGTLVLVGAFYVLVRFKKEVI
ncbi:MAG: Ig domain-containing protein [Coriobacteriia bacterium]